MFCVYLTVYTGSKLPPFYIGHTSIKNIERGYMGSVTSREYREIWKKERKNNSHLFRNKPIKLFETRQEALKYEYKLHKQLNVVNNPLYINKSDAFGPKGQKYPWNKGKKGAQTAWNKGLSNLIAKERMSTNNPMHNKDIVLKMRKTKLDRPLYATWSCRYCGRSEIRENTIKKMNSKFCNHSCATTYNNIHNIIPRRNKKTLY